jgi:peptidoglycan/LPS O-acetylase OafA/YrhL
VIVFFVLSGYWVGGSVVDKLRVGRFSWASYAGSRLTRLWIVLLPALLLTFLVDQTGRALFPSASIYAETSAYGGVPKTPSYSLITLIGNVFFTQSIHVSEYGLNKPLWSLAYEFWYYVMFPALLTALWKGGSTSVRLIGLAVFLVCALVAGPTVLLLFPAWLAGALVASYRDRIAAFLQTMGKRSLAWWRGVSIAATLAAMVLSHEVEMPSRTGAWVIAAATSLMVFFLVVDVDWAGMLGSVLNVASGTAHASYSLYAIHMPIVGLLAAILVPVFAERWTLDFPHAVLGLLIIGLLMGIAHIFASLTEKRTSLVRTMIMSSTRSDVRS